MRVGLFGGSFNPIHNGHLENLKIILSKNIVDEIWIIPCREHPFNKELINRDDRINMINLAVGGLENIKVNRIEIDSKGKNYTFETIKKLKARQNHDFSLIIGEDILGEIKKWHRFHELVREVKFIIFPRDKDSISSTSIRNKLKKKESISGLVPEKVEEYIRQEGIYG